MITDKASISTENIDNSSLYNTNRNKPFLECQACLDRGVGFKKYQKPIYLDVDESTDIQSLKDKYDLSDETAKKALSLQGKISQLKGDKDKAKEAIENYLSYAFPQEKYWSFWGSIGQGLFLKTKVNQETKKWQLTITRKDNKGNRIDSFKIDDGFDYLWKNCHKITLKIECDKQGKIKETIVDKSIFFRGADPEAKTPLKKDINRGTQVVTEIDHLSLDEQLEIYKWITLTSGLTPWLIFSGSKSMHFHLLLNQFETIEKVVYLRRLLCILTNGDDALTRPSQPFRFPEFARVEKGKYQTIKRQGKNHSYDEILEGLKKCFEAKGLSFPNIDNLGDAEWQVVSKILRDSKESKVNDIFAVLEKQCLSPLQDGTFKELHSKALNKGDKSEKRASSYKAKNYHHNGNSARGDENLEAKIELLLKFIPPRVSGSGTYLDYRGIFCGVASVLGIDRAIDIAYTHSPEGGNWSQFLESSSIGNFSLGTVIHFAQEWGGFDPTTDKEWIRLNQDDLIEKAKSVPPLYDEPYREKQLLHLIYILGIKDDPKDPEYPDRDIQAQVFRCIQNYLGFERTLELAVVNCPNKTRAKWVNILARSILNKKRVKHNIGYLINLAKRLTGWSPEDDQRWLDLTKEAFKQENLNNFKKWSAFTPDDVYQGKYLKDIIVDVEITKKKVDFSNLIYAVKSFKGTGKTFFIKWFYEKYLNKKPIIFISDRNRLISINAGEMKLIPIDKDLDNDGWLASAIDSEYSFSICLDSLWRLHSYDLSAYHLIFDEAESCHETLHNGQTAIKSKRDLVWATIAKATKQCKSVLLFDADLSDQTVDYFSKISGKATRKILNTYNPVKRKATIFNGRGSLKAFRSEFFNDVADGKKLFFVADSEKEAKSYHGILKPYLKDKVILISQKELARTAVYPDNQKLSRFLEKNGQAIKDENIKVVLATPCIQAGISLENLGFDCVYGYLGHILTPKIARQFLARDRSNCERKIYFRASINGTDDDSYTFKPETILKNKNDRQSMIVDEAKMMESFNELENLTDLDKNKILEVFKKHINKKDELTEINYQYQALLTARKNIANFYFKDIFIQGLIDEGYELNYDFSLKINPFNKEVKKVKKEQLEAYAQLILDAPLIGDNEAFRLKMQVSLTEREEAKLVKYYFNVRFPDLEDRLTKDFILKEFLKNNYRVLSGIENYHAGLNPELENVKATNQFYGALRRSFKSKIYLNEKKNKVLITKLFTVIGRQSFFDCSWTKDKHYGFTHDEAKDLIYSWGKSTKHLMGLLGINYSYKSCFTKVIHNIAKMYGYTLEEIKNLNQDGSVNLSDQRRYCFKRDDYWCDDYCTQIINGNQDDEQIPPPIEWDQFLDAVSNRYKNGVELNKTIFDDIINPDENEAKTENETAVIKDMVIYKNQVYCNRQNEDYTRDRGGYNEMNSYQSDSPVTEYQFTNLKDEKIDLFSNNNNLDFSPCDVDQVESAIPHDDYPSQNEHLAPSNGGNEQSITTEIKPSNLVAVGVQKSKLAIGQVIRYIVERWNGKTYIQVHIDQGVICSMYGDSIEVESGGQASWIRLSAILNVVQ